MVTEFQIEMTAERRMDALDARYLRGELTTDEYDREVAKLDAWTKAEYAKADRSDG